MAKRYKKYNFFIITEFSINPLVVYFLLILFFSVVDFFVYSESQVPHTSLRSAKISRHKNFPYKRVASGANWYPTNSTQTASQLTRTLPRSPWSGHNHLLLVYSHPTPHVRELRSVWRSLESIRTYQRMQTRTIRRSIGNNWATRLSLAEALTVSLVITDRLFFLYVF